MQTEADEISVRISVAAQSLEVHHASGVLLRRYPVSTSRFGLGSEPGSLRTPLGRFKIAEKIGGDAPLGAVFKSRVFTGQVGLRAADADLVLTRILWLEGLETHNANTHDRYIYIHGTNHEAHIGKPASHGCIRLRNTDVVDLYALVPVGTAVWIVED